MFLSRRFVCFSWAPGCTSKPRYSSWSWEAQGAALWSPNPKQVKGSLAPTAPLADFGCHSWSSDPTRLSKVLLSLQLSLQSWQGVLGKKLAPDARLASMGHCPFSDFNMANFHYLLRSPEPSRLNACFSSCVPWKDGSEVPSQLF